MRWSRPSRGASIDQCQLALREFQDTRLIYIGFDISDRIMFHLYCCIVVLNKITEQGILML